MMSGHGNKVSMCNTPGNQIWVVFNRFDGGSNDNDYLPVDAGTLYGSSDLPLVPLLPQVVMISVEEVKSGLKKIKKKKGEGPDGIIPDVLKMCAE